MRRREHRLVVILRQLGLARGVIRTVYRFIGTVRNIRVRYRKIIFCLFCKWHQPQACHRVLSAFDDDPAVVSHMTCDVIHYDLTPGVT